MRPTRITRTVVALAAVAGLSLAACGPGDDATDAPAATSPAPSTTASSTGASTADASASGVADTGMLDSTTVHHIAVEVDAADVAAMIAAYDSTGDKEWIAATVTIDGVTYEQVGMRLKGNSSLRDVGAGSAPEELPWLLKFDELVDGQAYGAVEELVIRSNNSATALNEAVALDLLELAGLAAQDAMATGFSVNGSAAVLRLALENPDGEWVDAWLGTDGTLYKAESGGDYSYRGDDAAAYDGVFDLEAGDDETLAHLTSFLAFVDEADDATFAAELADRLDVDAFARYLAMMELLSNSDDIDGPGNNSYLYYDPTTDRMTVVPWDMNLALGVGMGGDRPGRAGGGGGGAPAGAGGGGGAPDGAGGMRNRSNVLVERFTATPAFAALYDAALADLRAQLFDSGIADDVLAGWVAVLGTTDLVGAATVGAEAAQVAAAFPR